MTTGVFTEYIDVDTQRAVLFRGPRILTDIPCILCHGARPGETVPAFWIDQGPRVVPDMLTNGSAHGGLFCAGTILGGGATWGNDASINAITDLVSDLNVRYGTRTDKVALYGESMGALTMLNWAWRNPSKVAYIAMTIPALNLTDIHDDNLFGFGASIEAAYGGLAGYNAARATHDPMLNLNLITPFGDRIGLWAGVADALCDITFARTLATTTGAHLFEEPGGHQFDLWDVQVVADWFLPKVLYKSG